MRKYILLTICTLLILTGCQSKSFFSTIFDGFTFDLYDNNKRYVVMPQEKSTTGMKVITQMKEQSSIGDTWFINSFVIIKTSIKLWTDIKELVDANMKKLQLKVPKYKTTDNVVKKVLCDDKQYSWYIRAFSYQVDKETIYGGQYFLMDKETLYLLSLSSDTRKDIKSFIASLSNISCNN